MEYTYPKFKVDTVYTAPQVVRTPLLLGHIQSNVATEKKDPGTNALSYSYLQNQLKPIYGEVHQVVGLDVHSTQYVDSQTGKRVDQWGDKNLRLHGVDESTLIINDTPLQNDIEPGRRLSSLE